jgi:hypothetical protein
MQRKLVLWFVLLIVGFLAGFILQYARLRHAQQELSASTKQLGSCQAGERLSQLRDTATAMFLEAVQKNYGKAGQDSKEFFDQAQRIQSSTGDSALRNLLRDTLHPAIRSRQIWQRETPQHFQKYRHSYPRSSRPRSIKHETDVGTLPTASRRPLHDCFLTAALARAIVARRKLIFF